MWSAGQTVKQPARSGHRWSNNTAVQTDWHIDRRSPSDVNAVAMTALDRVLNEHNLDEEFRPTQVQAVVVHNVEDT